MTRRSKSSRERSRTCDGSGLASRAKRGAAFSRTFSTKPSPPTSPLAKPILRNRTPLAKESARRWRKPHASAPVVRLCASTCRGSSIGVAPEPLSLRLGELLRQCSVLHGDETPVAQLDPGCGKTKRVNLWVYRSNALGGDAQIVYVDDQPGRSGKHVVEFLAAEALRRIGELCAIKAEMHGTSSEERARRRKEASLPRLEVLKLWLQQNRKSTADGSALAKAIDYLLHR